MELVDNIDFRLFDCYKFDVVWVKFGDDFVYGWNFFSLLGVNDIIFGVNGNDVIYGYYGDDFFLGEGDLDIIYGGFGNDVICGGYYDWIFGGIFDGVDKFYGEEGDDMIFVEGGDD